VIKPDYHVLFWRCGPSIWAAGLKGDNMADDDIKEARARANALRESLPQSVDAAALGARSKAPFQLLLHARGCDAGPQLGCVIWRI
jgi:hypothetical protein